MDLTPSLILVPPVVNYSYDGTVRGGIDVRPASEGLRCLGHPLGTDDFVRDYLMRQAAGTGTVVDAIINLVQYNNSISVQTAYLQLRYCAEPRIAHLLRHRISNWLRAP